MAILGYEPLECSLPGSDSSSPSVDKGLAIAEVLEGSLAETEGLRVGDHLLSINGKPIRDPIDLMFHSAEERLSIRFKREDESKVRRRTFKRNWQEELGIVLSDFQVRTCNNQCVFCFIHQNPKGLRRGIYFKDGDFRMSFLHGNYVTMTNFSDDDFSRIIDQRLPPMYVSVHTTDHALRQRMLGVKQSSDVLDDLGRLAHGGIDFHTQIVLCPGWNDGAGLERTISDLSAFVPNLLSIAIVPLGLTDHRTGLPDMEPVTKEFCRKTIDQIEPIREDLHHRCGTSLLFLADEFYVTAGRSTPKYEDEEVIHQLENGVGMVWEFMRPWRSVARNLPERLRAKKRVAIMTGLLGLHVLKRIETRLNKIENLEIEILPCTNQLFGEAITVSGLLSGNDLLREMNKNPPLRHISHPWQTRFVQMERFFSMM